MRPSVSERETFVPRFLMVTLALATTAPLASVTVPTTSDVFCAFAAPPQRNETKESVASNIKRLQS